MNEYYEPKFKKNVVSIDMGESYVSDQDLLIGTVLGSCIAVILHDPIMEIGGMNHFLMPEVGSNSLHADNLGRFGETSLPRLIEQLQEAGSHATDLRAKVFGGSSMLLKNEAAVYSVGPRNAEFALDFLSRRGIPVDLENVGGIHGRKIFYDVRTFTVYVKKLYRSQFHNA